MAKVNGYQLKEAIKKAELERAYHLKRFSDSLFSFPGEKKDDPQEIADEYLSAEHTIVDLQRAQAEYNSQVTVNYKNLIGLSSQLNMTTAIKMIGAYNRYEKMWRGALDAESIHTFGFGISSHRTRNRDEERALANIEQEDVLEMSKGAAKMLASLRMAVAAANATEIDIPWLPEYMVGGDD